MVRPKFINKYKLLKPMCDTNGVDITALKVGEVYEVTHQEVEVLDDEGRAVMVVIEAEANGFKSRLIPASFSEFFEEVKDGENL